MPQIFKIDDNSANANIYVWNLIDHMWSDQNIKIRYALRVITSSLNDFNDRNSYKWNEYFKKCHSNTVYNIILYSSVAVLALDLAMPLNELWTHLAQKHNIAWLCV